MIKFSKNNSLWNFPADMFVLSGAPIGIAALLFGYVFEHAQITIVAAVSVACAGAGLLFAAKLPLYRAGVYFSFGPSAISPTHRFLYYWGVGLAAGGCTLAALSIPLLRLQLN